MRVINRGFALPRRIVRWASDNPLRTAGGIAAVLALLVMGLSLDATGSGMTVAAVVKLARTRPAYPAVVVAGVGVLLFWR